MALKDYIALFIKIISSWQVITVTVVVFLYFYLVSYVARLYRRSSFSSMFSAKPKKKKPSPAEPESAEGESGESGGDDLGLEEG